MFYAPNDVRGVTGMVIDTGSKFYGMGGTFHFPQIGAIASTAWGAGGTITYTANTEAQVTVVPTVVYTAVEIYEDALNTAGSSTGDITSKYGRALSEGVFQAYDETILQQHATTITTVGVSTAGYNFLEADYWGALEQLHASAKDKAIANENITAIYHPLQLAGWGQTQNFVSAAVRGGSGAGPVQTGVFGTVGGAKVFFTTNVQTLTSAINNLIIAKPWLILGRANSPKIELERTELKLRAICSAQFGVKVQSSLLGIRHLVQSV